MTTLRILAGNLAAEGAGAIFLVSFNYASEVRSLLDKYPHISFVNTLEHVLPECIKSVIFRVFERHRIRKFVAG